MGFSVYNALNCFAHFTKGFRIVVLCQLYLCFGIMTCLLPAFCKPLALLS